jgi:hypothetical protein
MCILSCPISCIMIYGYEINEMKSTLYYTLRHVSASLAINRYYVVLDSVFLQFFFTMLASVYICFASVSVVVALA